MGARFIDRETNTSEIEIRPHREEARTDVIHAHSQGIQVPSSSSEFSSHDMNMGGSTVRPCVPIAMPQLDGPASVCVQRKQPIPAVRKTTIPGEGYPNESDNDSHDNRFREDRRYPGRRRYYQERGRKPSDSEDNQGRGYPGRGRTPNDGGPPDGGPPDDGRPSNDGGPPDDGGPLMMEDPLMMEGPQEMEDCQEDLEDKDYQAHQDLLDQCVLILVQQPQLTLDTTTLENTFRTVGQSMLQLARAQDQTNRYLHEHLHQGQMNMQVHTGALQQLATSTYQRNFDHIFARIPIYDGK